MISYNAVRKNKTLAQVLADKSSSADSGKKAD